MDVPVDISNTRIETPRLILRPWKENDLSDFHEYASVEGVGEMAGWKHHDSIESSKKILDSFIDDKNIFAIVYKEHKKTIGSLGLHSSWANDVSEYRKLKLKEIGYVLSKTYWGQGLMPEAVRAVISFCSSVYGLDALTIRHFSHNASSRRVIEKCGFQFVRQVPYYAEQLQKTVFNMEYILPLSFSRT